MIHSNINQSPAFAVEAEKAPELSRDQIIDLLMEKHPVRCRVFLELMKGDLTVADLLPLGIESNTARGALKTLKHYGIAQNRRVDEKSPLVWSIKRP